MAAVRMEKIESTLRLAIEFRARLAREDLGGAIELLSDSCLIDAPEGVFAGREEAKRYFKHRAEERRGAAQEVEEIFGMGFRCVVRLKDGNRRSLELFKEERGVLSEILIYAKNAPADTIRG
ncbi:nuclear transport factor 2 family protein [bacterium]|nr:nuclear transport factor 2 family protein [bacterium]